MDREDCIDHLLVDRINRSVLHTLQSASRELTLTELAGNLGDNRFAYEVDTRERLLTTLHHKTLPQLDAVDLLEYDHESKSVSILRRGLDAIDRSADTEPRLQNERTELFGSGPNSSIGVLEGREQVYAHSRALADRADEELFLMYTSAELLHEDCLPYARDAIDRGVSFYLGAGDSDVRRFVREYLPEATIWEPQLDWMYDQTSTPSISRLIFADRKHAVVGLWDESPAGDAKREVAMIGEGQNNPLVVLVRELLGSRLDHLDYQSDDFLSSLPFEL